MSMVEELKELSNDIYTIPTKEEVKASSGEVRYISLCDGREIEFSIDEEDQVVLKIVGDITKTMPSGTLVIKHLALATREGFIKAYAEIHVDRTTFYNVRIVASKQEIGSYFVVTQSMKYPNGNSWGKTSDWNKDLQIEITEALISAYKEKAKNVPEKIRWLHNIENPILPSNTPSEAPANQSSVNSTEKIDDITLMEKAKEIQEVMFTEGSQEFEGHKFVYWSGGQVKALVYKGHTYFSQNKTKKQPGTNYLSAPAQRAVEGHNIMWISKKFGEYLAKIEDGVCEFCKRKEE